MINKPLVWLIPTLHPTDYQHPTCRYHPDIMDLYIGSWLISICVSRFGLAVKLVSRGTSVRIRIGSPSTLKVVVCGHCLVTLSLTIHETLKWLSSLPTLRQEVILVVTVSVSYTHLRAHETA